MELIQVWLFQNSKTWIIITATGNRDHKALDNSKNPSKANGKECTICKDTDKSRMVSWRSRAPGQTAPPDREVFDGFWRERARFKSRQGALKKRSHFQLFTFLLLLRLPLWLSFPPQASFNFTLARPFSVPPLFDVFSPPAEPCSWGWAGNPHGLR